MALCQGQTVAPQAMQSFGIRKMYTGVFAPPHDVITKLRGSTAADNVVLQANGLQLKMCVCARHISRADTSDQYVPQANTADLALLPVAQRKMERQGTSLSQDIKGLHTPDTAATPLTVQQLAISKLTCPLPPRHQSSHISKTWHYKNTPLTYSCRLHCSCYCI